MCLRGFRGDLFARRRLKLNSLAFLDPEVQWGSYMSRSKAPVGAQCLSCVKLHRTCYQLMSWEELLTRVKTDASFAAEVMETKKVVDGEKESSAAGEELVEGTVSGYRVERPLVFVSCEERD